MPFHKKFERKVRRRVGQYSKCAGYVASDARRALVLAKHLKSIINVEFKHLTQVQTNLAVPNAAGVIIQLTNVGLGDTSITRDGSNIKFVSIGLEYHITQHASAVSTICRIMVVHDRQTNQAIYTTADLLHDATAVDSINSPRNLDNTRRFQVLYDKRHMFSDSGSTIGKSQFYKKLQLKLRYDANAADITDLTQSSLSLLIISNEPTNTPLFHGAIRLRYVDN